MAQTPVLPSRAQMAALRRPRPAAQVNEGLPGPLGNQETDLPDAYYPGPSDIVPQSPEGSGPAAPSPDQGHDTWSAPFVQTPLQTVAGSMQALPARERRRYLAIQNQSGAVLSVNFGAAALAINLQIAAGASVEWNQRGAIPNNSVNIFCAGAGNNFVIIEG